jgi:ATP-dependent helicase/nuclease subunit B
MSTTAFEKVAAELLHWESGRVPDLSACTVLLPHLNASGPLLAALRRLVDRPVFLPPRLHTMTTLLAEVPAPGPVEPDCQRLAQVHDVLLQAGICRTQGLWLVARELLDLIDELSAAGLQPEDAPQRLLAQVRSAYDSRVNRLLEAESRLVLELWQAMQQGRMNDPIRDRAQRMALAARAAPGPLYTLGLPRLSRLEEGFLAQWAARQPVRSLTWLPALPARRAVLDAVWQGDGGAPMPERAAAVRQRLGASPLLLDVRLLAAPDLEAQAQAAATQVRNWVAEGRVRIALVALDRMAARRLRALLEREQILIEDETGWTFATASVAHVLDRLFALLQDDCYHRDLLDLLKSPFAYADLDSATRLGVVTELERAIRREGIVSGWREFVTLAEKAVPGALAMLDRLDSARRRLSGQHRSLGEWQQGLLAALADLGADQALAADVAGRQLLALLQTLHAQVATHPGRYAFGAWREWLALQLEHGTFRDDSIDSPIRLISPGAARLRDFDAAVLLGADAAHLPPAGGGGVFNDRVRSELGLPATADQHAELRATLSDILCHIPRVLVTWQARIEGDPNPASPWLEVLDSFHHLAWGMRLKQSVAGTPVAPMPPAPAPTWPTPSRLPTRLTASGWQSLVACPYRFFARHILQLAEAEAVPEEMEKRDYGELVHAILQAFHAGHPRLAEATRETLVEDLVRISREVFAPHRRTSYLTLGWQLRWERRLTAYVDWAIEREAQGYRWQAGEVCASRSLSLPEGGEITLYGRLDRVEAGPSGQAVLDYKTRSRDSLRRSLKRPGEDVQLPFYGLLTDAVEAAYVALDDDKVDTLAPGMDLPSLTALEMSRLEASLAALQAGAALPANGAEQTCCHCEMRGLCRRDHWPG